MTSSQSAPASTTLFLSKVIVCFIFFIVAIFRCHGMDDGDVPDLAFQACELRETDQPHRCEALLKSDPRFASADHYVLLDITIDIAAKQAKVNHNIFALLREKAKAAAAAAGGNYFLAKRCEKCVSLYKALEGGVEWLRQAAAKYDYLGVAEGIPDSSLALNCSKGLPHRRPVANITADMVLVLEMLDNVVEMVLDE